MMTEQESKQMQALKDEIAMLRTEVDNLQRFVKALYAMMDEDGECEMPPNMISAADFRGLNT